VGLLRTIFASKKDHGVRPELVDHLTARAARRARNSMVIGDRYRANFNLGSKLRDSRKNRRTLGAVRHAVGGILHVTSDEDLA